MRYVKTVMKVSGAASAVATIVDVMNAIHATPVNTRCTFNAHVMSRSCRACSASCTRMVSCIENTRLDSNGGINVELFRSRISNAATIRVKDFENLERD